MLEKEGRNNIRRRKMGRRKIEKKIERGEGDDVKERDAGKVRDRG